MPCRSALSALSKLQAEHKREARSERTTLHPLGARPSRLRSSDHSPHHSPAPPRTRSWTMAPWSPISSSAVHSPRVLLCVPLLRMSRAASATQRSPLSVPPPEPPRDCSLAGLVAGLGARRLHDAWSWTRGASAAARVTRDIGCADAGGSAGGSAPNLSRPISLTPMARRPARASCGIARGPPCPHGKRGAPSDRRSCAREGVGREVGQASVRPVQGGVARRGKDRARRGALSPTLGGAS